MTRSQWIVCERTGRWAAAIRIALERGDSSPPSVPRIFELRHMAELSARLEDRPESFVLLEVHSANFAEALSWLALASPSHACARFAALLDGNGFNAGDRQATCDALREAGAQEVAMSPRDLLGIVAAGHRQGEARARGLDLSSGGVAIKDWAWASLPWQEE